MSTCRKAFESACAAWPGVGLEWEQFQAHLRRMGLDDGGDLEHGEDLFLAAACLEGHPKATFYFEEVCLVRARRAIQRVRADQDFVDETLQDLRTRLLVGSTAGLTGYAGRGPLIAWVRVAATRAAIDSLRSRGQSPAVHEVSEAIAGYDPGPEHRLLLETHRSAFQEALTATLANLSPRDRNLLRRHLVEGMTLEEMAVPYGVHLATIARRLTALREEIAREMRKRLTGMLGNMGKDQLESVLQAVRSQVYVTLSPLAAGQGASEASRPGEG